MGDLIYQKTVWLSLGGHAQNGSLEAEFGAPYDALTVDNRGTVVDGLYAFIEALRSWTVASTLPMWMKRHASTTEILVRYYDLQARTQAFRKGCSQEELTQVEQHSMTMILDHMYGLECDGFLAEVEWQDVAGFEPNHIRVVQSTRPDMHERRFSRKDAVAAFRAVDERKLIVLENLNGSEDKTVQDEFFAADLEIADRHNSAVILPVVVQKWKCWETKKAQERVLCVLCVYPNQRYTVGFPKWKISLLEDLVLGFEKMHKDWQGEKDTERNNSLKTFQKIALPAPVPSVLVLGPVGSDRAGIATRIAEISKQPLISLSATMKQKFGNLVFKPPPVPLTEEELAEAAAAEEAAAEEAAEEAAEAAEEAAAEAAAAAEEWEEEHPGEEMPPAEEEPAPVEEAPPAEEAPPEPTPEELELKVIEAQLIHNGQLLPDELAVQMMVESHSELGEGVQSWVLDGGVANQVQAALLMEQGIIPQFVIMLDVPLSSSLDRFEHIMVDFDDQKEYHMLEEPPLSYEETPEGIEEMNKEPDPDADPDAPEVVHLGPIDRVQKRREERPQCLSSRYYRYYSHLQGITKTYKAAGSRIIRCSTADDPMGEVTREDMLSKVVADVLAEINSVDELQCVLPAPAPADPRAKPPAEEDAEEIVQDDDAAAAEAVEPAEFIPADGERRMTQSGKFIMCNQDTVQLQDEDLTQPLTSVWMKTPRAAIGNLTASAPDDWPENKPCWWPNYFWGVLWPDCIELQNSENKKLLSASVPTESLYDEGTVGVLSVSNASIVVSDEISGQGTWIETELDACLIERKEAERQKQMAEEAESIRLAAELAATIESITETEAELEKAKTDQAEAAAAEEAAEEAAAEKEAAGYEEEAAEEAAEETAAEEEEAAEEVEPVDYEKLIEELETKLEELVGRRDELSPPAPPEEGEEGYEEPEEEEEPEPEPDPEEEEEEEPQPIKMVPVLQNAATGLYLAVDHEGTISCTSAPGYLQGKFVGLEAHSFAYRNYAVPDEEHVQFGAWRGLPNPLGTVSDSVGKWECFIEECKNLEAEVIKLYPAVANRTSRTKHPGAIAGPGTTFESFSAELPEVEAVEGEEPADAEEAEVWPVQYTGARVFHPASVSAELMQVDPFITVNQKQVELLEEQVEKCTAMKEMLQEELKAINCDQLNPDNRPKDGVPPKGGSLENLRSLHHPRQVPVAVLKAVLVVLGEDELALADWGSIRSHLIFRDVRNPWRNLHERLNNFSASIELHLGVLNRAVIILREAGGEKEARKENVMTMHLFRWVLLQAQICNLRVRQTDLQQSCNRSTVREFPAVAVHEEVAASEEAPAEE